MRLHFGLLTLSMMFVGCAAQETSDHKTSTAGSKPVVSGFKTTVTPNVYQPYVRPKAHKTDHVIPPREYYVSALAHNQERLSSSGLFLNGTANTTDAPEHLLYVNFGGAELEWGFGAQQSFILCEDEATLPAADLTEEQQIEILDAVRGYYADALVDMQVVTEEPTDGDYTTIHVGGRIEDLGCEADTSILGIAPLDRSNLSNNDIGYVFSDLLVDDELSEQIYTAGIAIAHEAGHAYGLKHITDADGAIMSATAGAGLDGFKRGRTTGLLSLTQDSPMTLRANLAPLADENGDFPIDEPVPSTWADVLCNQIDNLQSFILNTWDDRFDGDERLLQRPSLCE